MFPDITNHSAFLHIVREVNYQTNRECVAVGLIQNVPIQAAQALSTNFTRNTIWHRIIRVYMGFSTRYPWILFEEKTGIQKGRLDPVKVAQNSFQHFPRRSF